MIFFFFCWILADVMLTHEVHNVCRNRLPDTRDANAIPTYIAQCSGFNVAHAFTESSVVKLPSDLQKRLPARAPHGAAGASLALHSLAAAVAKVRWTRVLLTLPA